MSDTTLISADRLLSMGATFASWVVLDCSFDLSDPELGQRQFGEAHLPGARYAHLDRDLSGPKGADPRSATFTGRHPLPDRAAFAQRVGAWGIHPHAQVVTYDNHGSIYAARAWWLLRWLGHRAVAVLDGGRSAWTQAGGKLDTEVAPVAPLSPYPANEHGAMAVIDAQALLSQLGRVKILDARSADRWRGLGETLDPVGGHIPGSLSRFFKNNLTADGRFKSPEELRQEFERLGTGAPDAAIVHQCGSGVTACHNLLAMAHAGLSTGVLYPGSWSEWCADPRRPVALA
jgi:thiosulfate/3-mercaptopyruvate sulfurtransferase